MLKASLAKYYQKAKKNFRKKLVKSIFLKKKKLTKNKNMVENDKKNLSEGKKQKLVEYRKKYYKTRKNKKACLIFCFFSS